MAEDIWGEKPQMKTGTILGTSLLNFSDIEEMDAWLEKLKAHYETIEKQAETLRFLFGEEGVKTANLEKIQIWREKAELWDQYAIYDNDKVEEILVKDLITAYEKLEDVNTWFSGRFLSIWDKIPVEGLIVHKKRGLEVLRKILEAEGR